MVGYGYDFVGLGGKSDGGDENVGFVWVVGVVFDKFFYNWNVDGCFFGVEFDLDGVVFGGRVRVGGCWWRGEFFDYVGGGMGGEGYYWVVIMNRRVRRLKSGRGGRGVGDNIFWGIVVVGEFFFKFIEGYFDFFFG